MLVLDITSILEYTSNMIADKKDLLFKFLQEQIAQADFRTKAYVFDENNHKNPTRNCFVKLRKYINDFLEGNQAVRWLIFTGFRGVGKTTLLSQLYYEITDPEINKLYLSVDHVTQIMGVSLQDVLSVYEELLGTAFERIEKPVILFLDEVQYDKNWAITLKSIFDRSTKIFILATGSSALSLQKNPDIARRAFSEKLFPMSFTEYIKIKNDKFEILGLAKNLRHAIFESKTARNMYLELKSYEQKVREYWSGIERLEIDRYMKYGTLPFAVKLKNEGLVYDQIKKILDRVVSADITEMGQFKSDIVGRIPEILYTIAASDKLSVTNLSKNIGMNKVTLTDVLSILEQTETITRIYPHGSHISQVRKPSKYLFASPAFRSMYYNLIGNIISESSYMGKLLEDTVGLYLNRYLWNKDCSLTYDSSEKGADFVVGIQAQNIIIEAGFGEKGFEQINNTARRVATKYGIAVSMAPLRMNQEETAVTVPISYFLLL